jgi:hypothetical protein
MKFYPIFCPRQGCSLPNNIKDSLCLPQVTKSDLIKITHIMNNKKSTGLDGMLSCVLRSYVSHITEQ